MSFNSEVMLGSFPAETGVVPPNINVVYFFDNAISKEKLAEAYKGFGQCDRLRSVVKGGMFELVDELDVEKNHIETHNVNNNAEMRVLIDQICQQDLPDMSKIPPWRLHFITNEGKGQHALIMRVHHVVGDGMALIVAMGNVLRDAKTGNKINLTEKASSMKGGSSGKETGALEKLACMFKVLGNPASAFDTPTKFFPADKTTLQMKGTRRVTVHLPTVKLSFVKDIKNAAKVTVNDVMMTAIGGAIHRYCEKKGTSADELRQVTNRALLPVALPRAGSDLKDPAQCMRNKWAFASLELPVSGSTSKERLEQCSKATQALKATSMVGVQFYIQTYVLPYLPAFLRQKTAYDLFSRHSMVFSNLPGEEIEVSIGGETMKGLQVVFPNLLPQVLLISYHEQVFANMCIDPALVDEEGQQELKQCYLEELRGMAKAYGVSAADEEVIGEQQCLA